jgi:RNA recognition motif-containing protein
MYSLALILVSRHIGQSLRFGKIEKIEIKNGNNSSFAFLHVDFDDPNMEKNLDEMNQVVMDGQRVVVEVAKGRERHDMGAGNKPKSNLRITISNIEGPVSWQDLKDWARVCGNVNFANVFNGADGEKVGVIEFEKVEEFESALSRLEDEPLKGQHVKVAKVRASHALSSVVYLRSICGSAPRNCVGPECTAHYPLNRTQCIHDCA